MNRRVKAEHKRLDARIKFLMLISTGALSFFASDLRFLICLFLPGVILYIFSGWIGQAFRLTFVFTILLIIQSLVLEASFANAVTMILGITLFYASHILPIYMLFYWMVETTTISEWMKSMERSHMPKGFIITTATLLRYAPTISYEFSYMKNTMKMRGIGLNVFNFFKKPVKMIQYSLTPLLLRSVKIADDLSASAMTRGIEYEVRRSSYYDVRIDKKDIFILGMHSLFLLISWLLFVYSWGVS